MIIQRKNRFFSLIEILIIVLLACGPLFMDLPYRVNIFLSWEGAYRMSEGQIPFKDFGMPLGYMYWVIPSFFFKIFGAQMITLIKAQVFINILSGLAFRSILKSLSVQPGARLLCVLLYCISYSFFNFWPWYNHTVIVYEMIGLALLIRYFFSEKKSWLLLSLSALFLFFSFFTKQDAGALACILYLVLLLYYCFSEKKWVALTIFLTSLVVITFAIIAPLTKFGFTYWFNYGQEPHTSRFSLFDIVDEFLYSSQFIKFYLILIVMVLLAIYKNIRQLLQDKRNAIFLLLTLGILAEASVLQVTSYTPPDNNIFYHSFAFAFILSNLAGYFNLNFYRNRTLSLIAVVMMIWWSGVFWKYIQGPIRRMLDKSEPHLTAENIVDRNTYILRPPVPEIPMNEWTSSKLRSFNKIKMPKPTVDGIYRLLKNPTIKNNKDLQVLNMTELTPLALEIPFKLETGDSIPLWHHLGVSMFNKEAAMYERKIVNRQYDLVLFEYIPSLNNFYPFRVRDTLLRHYQKTDSFPAPRRGETQGMVEVFIKKSH